MIPSPFHCNPRISIIGHEDKNKLNASLDGNNLNCPPWGDLAKNIYSTIARNMIMEINVPTYYAERGIRGNSHYFGDFRIKMLRKALYAESQSESRIYKW